MTDTPTQLDPFDLLKSQVAERDRAVANLSGQVQVLQTAIDALRDPGQIEETAKWINLLEARIEAVERQRLDGENDLGLRQGANPAFPSGNNATRLSAASTGSSALATVLPGGTYEIPEPIVCGPKHGYAMRGAGGRMRQIGDASSLNGPWITKFVWTGRNNGKMLVLNNAGSNLDDLNFQGCRVSGRGLEPVGAVYPDRAEVGIQINTSTGGAVNASGKHNFHRLRFCQLLVPILIGHNTDDPNAASYLGHEDDHADTLNADDIYVDFPYDGEFLNQGTGVWIRNKQSLDNHFGTIRSHGNPAQIFWQERGGKTTVGQISHVGSSAGRTICVRVGLIDVNEGGLTIGHVDMDAGATQAMLLKHDYETTKTYAFSAVTINSAAIPQRNIRVPQIDVGPGSWTLRDIKYLKAGAIKMTGANGVCHVHLENCVTQGCNIRELVDEASSGNYLFTWRNVHVQSGPGGVWNVPFEDSDAATEIRNGSWTRLTFDQGAK
jgi:hypothetical protein